MLPDDPRHGSNAGHVAGCREDCCRLAHNEYRRSVWRKRYARRTDHLYIDSTGTIRRLRALQALGWRFIDIDREMGHTSSSPSATRSHNYAHQPKVHIDNARAVAAVYERLSMTFGPSTKLRAIAPGKGWVPPLAWDDIDDVNEQPKGLGGSGRNLTINATRAADLEHFAHMGDTLETACERLDVNPDTLWKWCNRHGHADLYERLAERTRRGANQWTEGRRTA